MTQDQRTEAAKLAGRCATSDDAVVATLAKYLTLALAAIPATEDPGDPTRKTPRASVGAGA